MFLSRDAAGGEGGGMRGGLEGSLGTDVPLIPSNPEHVQDKMICSFRVFVTHSPTRQFPLPSRNGPPLLGEDIITTEAL